MQYFLSITKIYLLIIDKSMMDLAIRIQHITLPTILIEERNKVRSYSSKTIYKNILRKLKE